MIIVATVQKVIENGRHGPFVVAISDNLKGSVTFSLREPGWSEKRWPEPGDVVVIEDVYKKRAGWRAKNARFFRPSDQKRAEEKKTEL